MSYNKLYKDYVFGIDVGGTTVKIGVFHKEEGLIDKWEIRTHTEENGKYILSDIVKSVKRYVEKEGNNKIRLKGVGVGVPGAVLSGGIVNSCVNLGWGYLDVRKELSSLLNGIPVCVANDANAAALGEMWKGGGKGYRNIVMVTIGTGVGGGIVLNGKILTGAFGAAGEIGHLKMEVDEKEVCGCGKYGCLEQYASAKGIVRIAQKKLKTKSIGEYNLSKKIGTAKDLFDLAKKGERFGVEVVEQWGDVLGRALANISAVIDPQVFVIGGGVSKAGDIVLETIEKNYRKYVFHASENTKFELAYLGNDAGIYGAAKMIFDK